MKYKEFYTVLPIQNNSPKIIQGVVQYDTANVVQCVLVSGDDPFDFSGYTDMVLNIVKPDGHRIHSIVTSDTRYNVENPYLITAIDPEHGRLSFTLNGQATIVTGTYFAQLSLLCDGVVMTTVKLNYLVQEGMPDLSTEEVSGNHYSGIANVLARWSSIESSEAERIAAENARLERDDERTAADADREARMKAIEAAVNEYLRLADYYVDQTEANKEAARLYAELAARPSEAILRQILAEMDYPDKDYVDAQDEYYDTTDIDGNIRKIQIKRTESNDSPQIWDKNGHPYVNIVDQDKFNTFFATCVASCTASDYVQHGPYIDYDAGDDGWSMRFYCVDLDLHETTFTIADMAAVGLGVISTPGSDYRATLSFYTVLDDKLFDVESDDDNTGDAAFEITNDTIFKGRFRYIYHTPATVQYKIVYDGSKYKLFPLLYCQSLTYYEQVGYTAEQLLSQWGITATGTPQTNDEWTIYVPDASEIDLDYGEIGMVGSDVYVGAEGGEKIQLTRHYEVGPDAPDRTDIFWIDTSDGAMLKYYNGIIWVTCNTAVFA